jgi:hypothetical protein
LGDREVDAIDEGVDVALRLVGLVGSALTARNLGSCRRVAVAAPRHFQERGRSRKPLIAMRS